NPMIWMSPPPVLPEMLEEIRLFNFDLSNRDLSSYREVLTGKKGYIVDPLGKRMHDEDQNNEEEDEDIPAAWNYLSDGLHPSLSGHVNTVKELIRFLALAKEPEEGSSFETPDDYETGGDSVESWIFRFIIVSAGSHEARKVWEDSSFCSIISGLIKPIAIVLSLFW